MFSQRLHPHVYQLTNILLEKTYSVFRLKRLASECTRSVPSHTIKTAEVVTLPGPFEAETQQNNIRSHSKRVESMSVTFSRNQL